MKTYILQQLQAVQANPILSSFTLTIRENQNATVLMQMEKELYVSILSLHILLFFPKEAEKFYAEAMAYQEEEEKHQEELSDKVIEYVGQNEKS